MQRSTIIVLSMIVSTLLIFSDAEKAKKEKDPNGKPRWKGEKKSPQNNNVKSDGFDEKTSFMVAPLHRHTERIISFSGYKWHVKSGYAAPGKNYWSASTHNVWKDDKGLHLKITRRNGKWYCAEIFSDKSLGYGKYTFYLVGRPDNFDKNVVLGLFTYPKPKGGDYIQERAEVGEIDIEFAKELIEGKNNAHYAIHYQGPRDEPRTWEYPFRKTLKGNYSTHSFNWQPASVDFRSQHGHREATGNPGSIIGKKTFRGSVVPKPLDKKVHINLWLFDANQDGRGDPPNDREEVEIVIRDFQFTPLDTGTR